MEEATLQAVRDEVAGLPERQPRVIIATGGCIGEGFDDAKLDTLFLAWPISWKGTLQQYVGRLHRMHANKKVVRVYDYVDNQVDILSRIFAKRVRGYKPLGYVIEERANAHCLILLKSANSKSYRHH